MITIAKTTLGEAWLVAMKTVMEQGEDIFDEDIPLREIRNFYMTIQKISATITLHKAGEDKLACLSMIDFKYRDKLLDMTVVYRSQNIFWSQPGNMLALYQIQNDVATELGYKIGKIDLVVLSAHIYERDFDQVRYILNQAELQHLI